MNSCVGTKVLEGNVQKSLKYLSTAVFENIWLAQNSGECSVVVV